MMTYDEAHAEFGRRLMAGDWLEAMRWYRKQFADGLVIMPETEEGRGIVGAAPTIRPHDWLGENLPLPEEGEQANGSQWMFWEARK